MIDINYSLSNGEAKEKSLLGEICERKKVIERQGLYAGR